MAPISIDRHPSSAKLIVFGVMFAIFFAGLGALLYFWGHAQHAAAAVWIGAGVVLLAFASIGPWRRPIYLGWCYATFPLGLLLSVLLLASIYYAVLTPIGLIARLFRADPLSRRLEPKRDTYWLERSRTDKLERYFRQF